MSKTPKFIQNRYKNDIKASEFITVREFKNGLKITDLIDGNSKFTLIGDQI
jgi:hypothetical protein